MDRHAPLHCFRKHITGAGIHAQEVLEKAVRHGVVDVGRLHEHVKLLKSIPVVLESLVLKVDSGKVEPEKYVQMIHELLDTIRSLRQEALSWMVLVRQSAEGELEVWHKDFIQELGEYAGELWQAEKHLMEYIADFVVKERKKSTK